MAESRAGQPDAGTAAAASLARVLGLSAAVLRADTPLAPLGWDSLARVCWEDAMSDLGWRCRAVEAETVGDLARGCVLAEVGA